MDRELFSEFSKHPIQPAMLHMEPLKIHGLEPNYRLHVRRQLLFSWRRIRSTSGLFKALQENLLVIGFSLNESSALRIGKILKTRILKLVKDLRSLSGKVRKSKKELWTKIFIKEEEVESVPSDVIKKLVERLTELEEEKPNGQSR